MITLNFSGWWLLGVGLIAVWAWALTRESEPGSGYFPDPRPILAVFFAAMLTAGIVIGAIAAALLLSSCAGSKPPKPVDTIGLLSAPALAVSAPPADLTPAQVAQLPRSVQRQYRKNLKAQPRTVPLVQGRAAVAAGGSILAPVQTSYKPAAPVVQAQDSATVQVAQTKKGPAVAGEGNQVPVTTTKESWWRPLLPWLAVAALAYSLLPFLPLPGAGWLLLLLRRGRSREPETG